MKFFFYYTKNEKLTITVFVLHKKITSQKKTILMDFKNILADLVWKRSLVISCCSSRWWARSFCILVLVTLGMMGAQHTHLETAGTNLGTVQGSWNRPKNSSRAPENDLTVPGSFSQPGIQHMAAGTNLRLIQCRGIHMRSAHGCGD